MLQISDSAKVMIKDVLAQNEGKFLRIAFDGFG